MKVCNSSRARFTGTPIVWLLLVAIFLSLNLGLIMFNVAGAGFLGSPAFLVGWALGACITIFFGIRSAPLSESGNRLGFVSLALAAIISGTAMGSLATLTDFFVGFVKVNWIGWPTVLASGLTACGAPLFLRTVSHSGRGCD